MSGPPQLIAILLVPLLLGIPLTLLPHHLPGRALHNGALPAAERPAARQASAVLAGLLALGSLGCLLSLLPDLMAAGAVQTSMPWVPELGLDISLRLDPLSALFVGLIDVMGLLTIVYASGYLHRHDSTARFYSRLMLFMSAMLGVVLADNLLLLIVFWELTSLSSFLLIGYWGTQYDARRGARMALTVTGGGGLAMLGGFMLIGQITGTMRISELPALASHIQAHPLFPWALGLILVGCFTKSAQLPFHFWLPSAMAAPTPVSAYLHSATMVKAGIYVLLRLFPVWEGNALFQQIVLPVGLCTMAFAAAVAIFRHDLKALLAYSTVSHLGLIVCLIGIGTPLAMEAAVLHILNHASFKAALFMTAGIVDHQAGTRDMRKLGQLSLYLPMTATAATVATASMAGVPPLGGFVSKEMFLTSVWSLQALSPMGWVLVAVAALGATGSVAYSARFLLDTFFRRGDAAFAAQARRNPHLTDPVWSMRAPVLLLAAVCAAGGCFPEALWGGLVRSAASTAHGTPVDAHLALWHGWNVPLLISAVALIAGLSIYFWLVRDRRLQLRPESGFWKHWSGPELYTRTIDHLFALAGRLTSLTANGSLQRYLVLLLGCVVVCAAGAAIAWPEALPVAGTRPLLPATPLAWLLWGLTALGCVSVLRWHHRRLYSVVFISIVGMVTALCFVFLSSPDLALTQLSVEVISTVLLLMGLALLPPTTPRESSAWRKARDGALALSIGALVAWLAWVMLTRDHASIAWYFLQNALPHGGGGNVVNVILVDFRGYDTMGEITVLSIAGLGVMALMQGLRVERPARDPQGLAWSFAPSPLMLRMGATVMLPFIVLVALHVFLRGHQAPGGGFIAGLITAAGLVLQYMARGQTEADALLHVRHGDRFVRWIALGLGMAALTGLGAMVWGYPFLTSAAGHPVWPVVGEVPLASAALFDLGVYGVVIGSVLLTLSVLGQASRHAHPASLSPARLPDGMPGPNLLPTKGDPS